MSTRRTAPVSAPSSGPYIRVQNSPIHGRGVFARRPLRAGQRIIEYKGERIDWDEALRRHPRDPAQPFHTFYFSLGDGSVIDGGVHGNSARWINHSCAPNCQAQQVGDRVFIYALRDIAAGEELFFDYALELDARHTAKVKRDYACRCGAPDCRGTLLAPKHRPRK
ncbi:MAG: SET domain-containing protein [Thiomonas sp.]|jgi:SET domain-containing protein